MCGIFGVLVPKQSALDRSLAQELFQKLLLLSDSRGKEASGVAHYSKKQVTVYRTTKRGSQLLTDSTYLKIATDAFETASETAIIGHTRLETNGSFTNNQNNQPVITSHVVGIHNGICVNDEYLWNKVKKLPKTTELDSEAVFAYLDEQLTTSHSVAGSLNKLFSLMKGSASLAFFHNQFRQLSLATNTGSIYYIFQPNKLFAFSSERFILNKAKDQLNLTSFTINHLEPGSLAVVEFATVTPTIRSFRKRSNSSALATSRPQLPIKLLSFAPDKQVAFPAENSLAQLKQHQINTTKISQLKRCIRCILPETMPLISFDHEGVCNYCRNHSPITTLGKDVLMNQLESIRSSTGEPDCILALSGGRDSSYGLHYLVKELGMHPIAYSYDWGMNSPIGRRNQARMVGELGIEHIIVSADIQQKRSNIRKNILAWLDTPDLGMVPLFMAGDKQAEYYAEDLRKKTNIKHIFYCRGNELENEEFKWGHCGIKNGSPKGVLHNLAWNGKAQLAQYYLKQFLANPKYINSSLIDSAFAYFVAYLMPLNFTYLWHYIPWDEKTIVNTLIGEYGWETDTESQVTWRIDDGSVAFYNYIYYKVQGFTENDTFRSNQIREGIITRAQALKLVHKENKPRYQALKWYFDNLQLDGEAVLKRVDQMPTLY